jgi:glutamate synthase (NADPH/NADH) large chain/glutamate synthase (ferredoxin)
MTGGLVVVLGPTGKNFGAGMSGGLAFVHDPTDVFARRINPAMIGLERVTLPEESESLRRLVAVHHALTSSPHAKALLDTWAETVGAFWKVVPHPPTPDTPKAVYTFDAARVPVMA